jgi:hypothetical protein
MNLNVPTASSARPKDAPSFDAFEKISWRILAVVIKFYVNASRSHGVDMFAKRPLIVALLSLLDLASSWLGLASSRASDNSKSKIDRRNVANDAQVMEWKKTGPRTYEFVGMVKVPPNHAQATAAVNIDGALTFMAPPEVTSSGWPVHVTAPQVTSSGWPVHVTGATDATVGETFTRSEGVAPEPADFTGGPVPVAAQPGHFTGTGMATEPGHFTGTGMATEPGQFTGPVPAKGAGGVTPSKGQSKR